MTDWLLYGQQPFGCGPFGGSTSLADITLVSSSPAQGAMVAPGIVPITFTLATEAGINPNSVIVVLGARLAILEGVFQSGFTGTIASNGSQTVITIYRTDSSVFTDYLTECTLLVADLACNTASFTISFNIQAGGFYPAPGATFTLGEARTWCEGKRIDIAWNPSSSARRMIIRRSHFSFCEYLTDPGENIYAGAVKSQHSDTDLDENRLYYYTLFFSDEVSPPYTYYTGAQWKIEGLSIKDYNTRFGDYVYALLPKRLRQLDGESARGDSQFLMRKYCSVIQCGVNLYRGWLEALLKMRDPDEMPSGRLNVASNQTGILEAQVADFGIAPERTFDAGVLRRIVAGIMPIYKQKGTCPGLVNLIKLFAGWDSRCDEIVEPACANNRIFQPWDGDSYLIWATGVTKVPSTDPFSPTIVHYPGYSTVLLTTLSINDGSSLVDLVQRGVVAAYDCYGSYGCVSAISTSDGGVSFRIDYDDPTTVLRSEVLVTGTASGSTFTVASVDGAASAPWQTGVATEYGYNAFAGMKFKDSAGTTFNITASTPSSGGTFDLTLSGTAADGQGSIAYGFQGVASTFLERQPISRIMLFVGSMSMIYSGVWDVELLTESWLQTYWSSITGLGSPLSIFPSFSPSDVVMWVQGVHEEKETVATVATNVLGTNNSVPWGQDVWVGYYVIPNWNVPKIYKIVTNEPNSLTVALGDDPPLTDITAAGAYWVILSEENAVKYQRLLRMFPSFTPHETRTFIKFED